MTDRFNGAFILAVAADALGWITEFESDTKSLVSKYGIDRITEFLDWEKKTGGRFLGYTDNIAKGSYSDDTQLLLCVCRSVARNGSVDNEYFSKVELKDWLSYVRGGGKSIKTAARNLEKKTPQWDSNFYKTTDDILAYFNAGANGAAMRMLPIILVNHANQNRMIEEVFKNSIITHGHPRAIVGSILYALAVAYFLSVDVLPEDPKDIVTTIAKELKKEAVVIGKIHEMGLTGWLDKWNSCTSNSFYRVFKETIEETLDLLRQVFRSIVARADDREVYIGLGALEKDTRGAGHISAVAALYLASKYVYDEPIQAVYECVNMLGSDTDTIGLMCGSMIGAYIGLAQIPKHLKRVQDSHYLLKCADAMYSQSLVNTMNPVDKSSIDSRYRATKTMDFTTLSVDDEINLPTLGAGVITSISEHETITAGKSVILIEADFEMGQSCKFSKVVSK